MATRREFLWQFGGGLGGIAGELLGEAGLAEGSDAATGVQRRLAPSRQSQCALFNCSMNGGVSQPDTFDYKPELENATANH